MNSKSAQTAVNTLPRSVLTSYLELGALGLFQQLASARPWQVADGQLRFDESGHYLEGLMIEDAAMTTTIAEISGAIGPLQAVANAELIVRCVNLHEELVARLEAMATLLATTTTATPSSLTAQALSEAHRTLEKARRCTPAPAGSSR